MTSNVKRTTSDSIVPPSAGPASRRRVEAVADRFALIGDYFPILLCVSPRNYSEQTVRDMAEAFEVYFARGDRYVVIAVTPTNAEPPDAKQRKQVTDWINSPRAKSVSGRLCLGSANIVPNAVMRGLHTALLWAWTPPFPMKPVSGAREAFDYAIERLDAAGVPVPKLDAAFRVTVQMRLQEIMG